MVWGTIFIPMDSTAVAFIVVSLFYFNTNYIVYEGDEVIAFGEHRLLAIY